MNSFEPSTRPIRVADRRLAGLAIAGSSGFVALLRRSAGSTRHRPVRW